MRHTLWIQNSGTSKSLTLLRSVHVNTYKSTPCPVHTRHIRQVMRAVKRRAKVVLERNNIAGFFGELAQCKTKEGAFAHEDIQEAAMSMHPRAFWLTYGEDTPLLQYFAMQSLAANGSSMDVERVFSAYKAIWDHDNPSLRSERAHKLAAVQVNTRAIINMDTGVDKRIPHEWMQSHLEADD